MLTPESFLRARGLEPLGWETVLEHIESHLGRVGPEAMGKFTRLHRAFVSYPTDHTCRAFYDFAAREGVLDLLVCHRFDRLVRLIRSIDPLISSGASVLDYGAGGGYLAAWLRDVRSCSVSVLDLSPALCERLAAQGFPAPQPGERFDVVLCADSLGEIHADEDDWLSDPENSADDGFGGELEARYGFAHKLAALKPFLAPRGAVLVFEPVSLEHFWRGAAVVLERAGWEVEILGPEPVWGLKLTRLGGA